MLSKDVVLYRLSVRTKPSLSLDAQARRDQKLIHVPWAVVHSQTRSHSSLSVFSAVAKRKLTGLVLRRLWMLDMDWRLLCGEAITVHLESQIVTFTSIFTRESTTADRFPTDE